jgi:hypothetical protein
VARRHPGLQVFLSVRHPGVTTLLQYGVLVLQIGREVFTRGPSILHGGAKVRPSRLGLFFRDGLFLRLVVAAIRTSPPERQCCSITSP